MSLRSVYSVVASLGLCLFESDLYKPNFDLCMYDGVARIVLL